MHRIKLCKFSKLFSYTSKKITLSHQYLKFKLHLHHQCSGKAHCAGIQVRRLHNIRKWFEVFSKSICVCTVNKIKRHFPNWCIANTFMGSKMKFYDPHILLTFLWRSARTLYAVCFNIPTLLELITHELWCVPQEGIERFLFQILY